jgi:hypothetical protein
VPSSPAPRPQRGARPGVEAHMEPRTARKGTHRARLAQTVAWFRAVQYWVRMATWQFECVVTC